MESESNSISHLKPTRVCNCKYSKCLKLYCDCFASGQYCVDCNCNNCFNKPEQEVNFIQNVRRNKIHSILTRDPGAFRPKIQVDSEGVVNKNTLFQGCNCKKTKCAKKYCECFNAGIACGPLCKCSHWYFLLSKNKSIVGKKKSEHGSQLEEFFKFLAEPLIKKKDSDGELGSEEGSTLCEESLSKNSESGNYEKLEAALYSRLITILNGFI